MKNANLINFRQMTIFNLGSKKNFYFKFKNFARIYYNIGNSLKIFLLHL